MFSTQRKVQVKTGFTHGHDPWFMDQKDFINTAMLSIL